MHGSPLTQGTIEYAKRPCHMALLHTVDFKVRFPDPLCFGSVLFIFEGFGVHFSFGQHARFCLVQSIQPNLFSMALTVCTLSGCTSLGLKMHLVFTRFLVLFSHHRMCHIVVVSY